jgi:hypothetical protein
LIDAENDYEMKDERHGISRHIDIWHQQLDGRWLCVSAHITAHKNATTRQKVGWAIKPSKNLAEC